MHDDEVAVTADDVRRLLAAQSPELAALPVTPLAEAVLADDDARRP